MKFVGNLWKKVYFFKVFCLRKNFFIWVSSCFVCAFAQIDPISNPVVLFREQKGLLAKFFNILVEHKFDQINLWIRIDFGQGNWLTDSVEIVKVWWFELMHSHNLDNIIPNEQRHRCMQLRFGTGFRKRKIASEILLSDWKFAGMFNWIIRFWNDIAQMVQNFCCGIEVIILERFDDKRKLELECFKQMIVLDFGQKKPRKNAIDLMIGFLGKKKPKWVAAPPLVQILQVERTRQPQLFWWLHSGIRRDNMDSSRERLGRSSIHSQVKLVFLHGSGASPQPRCDREDYQRSQGPCSGGTAAHQYDQDLSLLFIPC